jgi:hypothetical protein
MRAHATQVTLLDEDTFTLSNNEPHPLRGREYYTLLAGPAGRAGPVGPPGPAGPGVTRERDLFAGLS